MILYEVSRKYDGPVSVGYTRYVYGFCNSWDDAVDYVKELKEDFPNGIFRIESIEVD